MNKTFAALPVITCLIFLAIISLSACENDNNSEPPVVLNAAFSASPFEGHAPLAVEFTDESTGNPVSWKWDFQDDGVYDAFIQDPSFIYNEPGFYSVKLTVSDSETSDSVTIIDYVYLNGNAVQLNYEGILNAKPGELAVIPLKTGHNLTLGAITINLFYDKRLIHVTAIEGDMPGFVSNIVHENGSVVIAWSSVTQFVSGENEDLFSIKATLLTDIDSLSHYMRLLDGTEFADPDASILTGVELKIPSIDTR